MAVFPRVVRAPTAAATDQSRRSWALLGAIGVRLGALGCLFGALLDTLGVREEVLDRFWILWVENNNKGPVFLEFLRLRGGDSKAGEGGR